MASSKRFDVLEPGKMKGQEPSSSRVVKSDHRNPVMA
jgi:hypothetical protein